jgi:hypothetical protein
MSSESTSTASAPSSSVTPDTNTDTPAPVSSRPPLTGGCLCKSVRYRINRDLCKDHMRMNLYAIPFIYLLSGRCHCHGCQHLTSSAFSIGIVVPTDAFQLHDPENAIRAYNSPLPERPEVVNRIMFCSKCGCYLFHEPVP